MIRDIWEFPGRTIGRQVVVYSTTDSTNNRAAEHHGQPGLAFLADTQTAGRGQHGRKWTARPGASVLLSVLLAPPAFISRPAILTAWAAVSVCETLKRFSTLSPQIKWPNDVLVGEHKLAGILIEQKKPGEMVAGIGLNVRQTRDDFLLDELPLATSLFGIGVDRTTEEVAQSLLAILDEEYNRLIKSDFFSLESRWKKYMGLLNGKIEVECADAKHVGQLIELSFSELRIHTIGQHDLVITPESVLHLKEVVK
ncbi:MAG: biotin--[acetyl-CoA-carboxylase] ligase [Planctomycetia bacterium]|nr:biotin--[acetyl-CoA-carboxylase] ligase [Planctomycetia bacterium]